MPGFIKLRELSNLRPATFTSYPERLDTPLQLKWGSDRQDFNLLFKSLNLLQIQTEVVSRIALVYLNPKMLFDNNTIIAIKTIKMFFVYI
jgi:hypothetical protein